jgi:hypothetical protein
MEWLLVSSVIIMTYNIKPQDFAENLALNRTIGFLGIELPDGTGKKYLDFWLANKDLYINMKGAEKVAILRSYPSMAYNNLETQIAVNMSEQALQQRQIPFDIIFDQQLNQLDKYFVLVLANQESLTDKSIEVIKQFVKNGGGLVLTENTGKFDGWRRLREKSMYQEILSESKLDDNPSLKEEKMFTYGNGHVIYLPMIIKPKGEVKLGFESIWMMPENTNELESAVYWAAGRRLPLQVKAPDWVGISHDAQEGREIIHLFSYNNTKNAGGITLEYNGKVKKAWAVSPDYEGKKTIPFTAEGGTTVIRVSDLVVYEIIVLEK